MSLTGASRACAADAARLLAGAEAAEAAALPQSAAPQGMVRLAAPMSFGLAHAAPVLPELLLAHPGLRIDLHLSDEVVDLIGDGFDLALHIAALADSSLKARRLCHVRRLLVGAPAYFARHGRPGRPGDLATHARLGYAYLPDPDHWRFVHTPGEQAVMPDWSLPPVALHVVTPPGGPRPARVAATVDLLVRRLPRALGDRGWG